jgi:glutamate racemase
VSDDRAIGVFDSGLGGLTVVRALRERLPAEDIVYLGDTARVPYGTKGAATVIRYAIGCASHLVRRGVKAIVIACNTVSAVAPERLRVEFDIPILGVIEPGAEAAVAATRLGRIGVLATAGTIASGAYPRAVAALSTRVETIGQAAPLLVPLAEEGWVDGEVPRLAARRYLQPLADAGADVVVLGCTHYPLLRLLLEEETAALLGPAARVIDTAYAAAEATAVFLATRGLARTPAAAGAPPPRGGLSLLVTDRPGAFGEIAHRFLGGDADQVELVDL